jgi:hypothetical protein
MNTFEIIQNTTIIKVNYQGTQYKLVQEQDFANLTYTLFTEDGKEIIDKGSTTNMFLYDDIVNEFEKQLQEGIEKLFNVN